MGLRTRKRIPRPHSKNIRDAAEKMNRKEKEKRMPTLTERTLMTERGALALIVVISLIKMKGIITPSPIPN